MLCFLETESRRNPTHHSRRAGEHAFITRLSPTAAPRANQPYRTARSVRRFLVWDAERGHLVPTPRAASSEGAETPTSPENTIAEGHCHRRAPGKWADLPGA